MENHVWLKNPETGGVWACPAVSADLFRDKRGWVDTDEPDTEEYPEQVARAETDNPPVEESETP